MKPEGHIPRHGQSSLLLDGIPQIEVAVGQFPRRLAVHPDIVAPPLGAGRPKGVETSSVEAHIQLGIRPGRPHPITLEDPAVVKLNGRAARLDPSHVRSGGERGQRAQGGIRESGLTRPIHQSEPSRRIANIRGWAQPRPKHGAHPGPLGPGPPNRLLDPLRLHLLLIGAPRRRMAFPVPGQRIPAEGHRPHRLLGVPVADHRLTSQEGAREVQHTGIDPPVVRAGPETVGLECQHIEVRPRPPLVHPLEEEDLIHVDGAILHIRRQAGGEDQGLRVLRADSGARTDQHAGIALRIHESLPPMGIDVGLIPDLIGGDPAPVASGHRPGEAAEVL